MSTVRKAGINDQSAPDILLLYAEVAQVVEQETENLRVGSASLSFGTSMKQFYSVSLGYMLLDKPNGDS